MDVGIHCMQRNSKVNLYSALLLLESTKRLRYYTRFSCALQLITPTNITFTRAFCMQGDSVLTLNRRQCDTQCYKAPIPASVRLHACTSSRDVLIIRHYRPIMKNLNILTKSRFACLYGEYEKRLSSDKKSALMARAHRHFAFIKKSGIIITP